MEFTNAYYEFVNTWALKPTKNDSILTLGTVFIDPQKGYLFKYHSNIEISKDSTFKQIKDYSTQNYNIRIDHYDPITLSKIPNTFYHQFNIDKERPKWLKEILESNKNNVEYLTQVGIQCNNATLNKEAIKYLELAYSINPHYNELEYELSFAYNILEYYDKAIEILNKAIENNPENSKLFTELGYAYLQKREITKADLNYTQAFKLTNNSYKKGEIARQMIAHYFYSDRNKVGFDKWCKAVKKEVSKTSQMQEYVKNCQKDWNK